MKELEIRKHIEEEMAKTLKTMHPVNYLDAAEHNWTKRTIQPAETIKTFSFWRVSRLIDLA